MSKHARLDTAGDPVASLRMWMRRMLEKGGVDAVFALARTPHGPLPMPALIADPERLDAADPLAPAAPLNAAGQARMVLRHNTGGSMVFFLRPCEIRALVELVKLNQCTLENAVIVGLECLGRMENADYIGVFSDAGRSSTSFYQDEGLRAGVTRTCASCTEFLPEGADLTIELLGLDMAEALGIRAHSPKGQGLLDLLALPESPDRTDMSAVEALHEERQRRRVALFEETSLAIGGMKGFQERISTCLNCYNCRRACPVCYCNECVFSTDVFRHDPEVLTRRAKKRGMIKLPPDTVMFHITRLAHMAHACVGCGHCSSVCPSGIAVADIFRTVGRQVQDLFGYAPGKGPDQPIPYLAFEPQGAGGECSR